ncbi:uncharacterized protein HMPREF1120_05519 [Exophiala dermatitidis NIH/UT8656]|uniref:Uncharacterized protein n=1 Tax=Exophiala dermatitidis (strain ATCC 34100 / CBS 525.76 / NIH/UT8656) TaxID=858893 RepID=H6BY50_EXODN|nr:uncharacterized protein HMPREF1120_05519 [Exophiala dermatitidis NIH/UT8656]EHY57486.1 hypothetical protein HMPREF1120_05519 [Exophiala dermatitidis NIH/UT8656]
MPSQVKWITSRKSNGGNEPRIVKWHDNNPRRSEELTGAFGDSRRPCAWLCPVCEGEEKRFHNELPGFSSNFFSNTTTLTTGCLFLPKHWHGRFEVFSRCWPARAASCS